MSFVSICRYLWSRRSVSLTFYDHAFSGSKVLRVPYNIVIFVIFYFGTRNTSNRSTCTSILQLLINMFTDDTNHFRQSRTLLVNTMWLEFFFFFQPLIVNILKHEHSVLHTETLTRRIQPYCITGKRSISQ